MLSSCTFLALAAIAHVGSAHALPVQHITNYTIPQTPTNSITCFDFGPLTHRKTSLHGCKDTLRQIRQFDDFKRIQEFLERMRPLKPDKPPYYLASRDATCSVEIASHEQPTVADRFSFEQVKLLAQDILQDCGDEEEVSYGGEAHIGPKMVWKVAVRGWKAPTGSLDLGGGGEGGEVGILGTFNDTDVALQPAALTLDGLATEKAKKTRRWLNTTGPSLEERATCFSRDPSKGPKVSIDDCRSTLRKIRNYDNFNAQQRFEMYRSPTNPQPPLFVHEEPGKCEICVYDNGDPYKSDVFSFREVKARATQVLTDCEEEEYGGSMGLGTKNWVVAVVGVRDGGGLGCSPATTLEAGTTPMIGYSFGDPAS